MGSRWYATVVDSTDPARLARWWAEVLDYRVLAENGREVRIGTDDDGHPCLYFMSSTDGKVGRNRLHIDLVPDDREAEVERLVNMGARHVDIGHVETGAVVLADPEGNEFCLLRSELSSTQPASSRPPPGPPTRGRRPEPTLRPAMG